VTRKNIVASAIALFLLGGFVVFSGTHKANTGNALKDNTVVGQSSLTQVGTPYSKITHSGQNKTSDSNCVKPTTDCLNTILDNLSSENSQTLLTGLIMLWQHSEEFSKKESVVVKLTMLQQFPDYHVSDLAKFISGKADHLENQARPDEKMEELNQTQLSNGTSVLSNTSTEASLNDSLDYHSQLVKNIVAPINSSSVDERMHAVESAISSRAENAVKILADSINDTDKTVQIAAVDGLGQFLFQGFGDTEEIVELLYQVASNENAEIAEISQKLLARYENIKPELVYLQDPNNETSP